MLISRIRSIHRKFDTDGGLSRLQQPNDLYNTLTWLRRQELANAHLISVLEGRHTHQFAALKRVLDNKSLCDLDALKDAYEIYVDTPSSPQLVAAIWDSEPCEHWHSPPRRVIEIAASPRAELSCLEDVVLEVFSDDFEMCIVTNEAKVKDWIRANCNPIAWYSNVIYTTRKDRYRSRSCVSVRLLSAKDDKAVAEFIDRAGSDEHGSTYGQFELAKRNLFYKCYGTFLKDRLTGFLTLFERTTNVSEVLWVRVDGELRGHGIGSTLLSKVTDDILAAGKIPMYLTTPSNIPALSMISSLGYSFVYERYTSQITKL